MDNVKKKTNTPACTQHLDRSQGCLPSHSTLFEANLSLQCWATYLHVLQTGVPWAFHD